MIWVWILLGVGAGLAVYFEVVRPALALREALRRIEAGDFRPFVFKTRTGLFRRSARRLQAVAAMLQQLDRQIVDEGFSLRAILSSMIEGVLLVDRAQRIRLANDALGRMFGFSQSLINRTVIEVFRNHELAAGIKEALAHGAGRRMEISLEVPAPQGLASRHFEIYASGLRPWPSGALAGGVVVFHDITALRELEAVRREFVANVSHEFRTPLAIISGYIETLLDGALDDRAMAERSLRVMHKNSQRLSILIEELLTISRIEHRTEQLDIREMDLREALGRAIERLEAAIAGRGAEIVVSWEPDAEWAAGDSRRIEQVYTNLLENALRYGPATGVRVAVRGRRVGSFVRVDFSDNGPGIPEADQKHIFERFYRVHKDRSRAAGGSGLGLSIVKHIVEAHGGRGALESRPGEGSTFSVELPILPPEPSASRRAA
ncbi:MAG: ATP-binding protein [Terrimicrobiaceae bacterium]|nr:ATP-binding protein [Terrimicrobiaceae bacterium]